MKNTSYTVIITTYNSERDILAAIESAVNLSPTPAQIVVVDDGSSDQTIAIVEGLVTQYSTLNFYKLDKNSGTSAARNFGISKSAHEVCVIMDSDDYSEPSRGFEHLSMHSGGADITFVSSTKKYSSGHDFIAVNASRSNVKIPFKTAVGVLLGLRTFQPDMQFFIPACTMSIKKSFFQSLGGFDESLRRNEDADLVIRASLIGAIFSFSSQICVTRHDSFSSVKGGIIDVYNERNLVRKYSHYLTSEEKRYLEIKLNFRELYFKGTFLGVVRVLNYHSLKFLILNMPILFRRLIHDIKRKSL